MYFCSNVKGSLSTTMHCAPKPAWQPFKLRNNRCFGFQSIIYYYHPMVILAHLNSFILKLHQGMFIIVIFCYLSLPKVRCKQMHWGWKWLFNLTTVDTVQKPSSKVERGAARLKYVYKFSVIYIRFMRTSILLFTTTTIHLFVLEHCKLKKNISKHTINNYNWWVQATWNNHRG
jgi:hypothetical protein